MSYKRKGQIVVCIVSLVFMLVFYVLEQISLIQDFYLLFMAII